MLYKKRLLLRELLEMHNKN